MDLKLGLPLNVTCTFEIAAPQGPARGTRFKDPRERVWTVREVEESRAVILRDPSDTGPHWNITLVPEHPAYRIEPGETLLRQWTGDEIRAAREEVLQRFKGSEGFETVGVSPCGRALHVYVTRLEAGKDIPSTASNGLPLRVRALAQIDG